ncbi:MAG TPA: adenylate/guanylate cyclase domain-containing protein [Albidovulum sp.]|uniref:adenylate/guanylate cyclase domain-containing protein n=1 Tax=Albidovulum sp. TaxID=1872424 RepID=UPI002B9B13EA|nr:adenylate/guanylate cyclase domain-containing protein [Albidovulum sp.]
MERKLSAILVADIVGYSAQMERDEEGTFARVTARRKDLFEPEVVRHSGRIFKLVGDGVLVEFQSAVQAVECAVALQAGLQDRNRSLPEDQAIHLRIGINLGEVIVDGDDRYGEGVNLAARLEQLADAGGICVSEKVAREVERKLAFGFESMGERHVRNIAEPVHVYRVSPDRTKGPRAEDRRGGRTRHLMRLAATLALVASLGALAFAFWPGSARQASPPALAILPFDNVSGDAAQDYLGTGVADDIITMLSTSPTLRVVSKTSSFGLKGAGSLQEIADDLNVDYILEGSVRRTASAFRISAQLVQGSDGQNLWSERFEKEGTDVALLQEEIARKVYATVAGSRGEVAKFEMGQAWSKSAPSLEEYDYHLRGMAKFLTWTDEGKEEARRIWEDGLERFPQSALLRIELAGYYFNKADEGLSTDRWADIQTSWRLLREADKAPVKSRMEEWLSHYIKAQVYPIAVGDFESAAREAEAAHALVPFDPMSSIDLSFVMTNAGYAEKAVEWAEYGVNNEAAVPDWYRDRLAWAYYNAGRAEDAVREYDKISYLCTICKAAALVRAGRIEDGRALIAEVTAVRPDITLKAAGLAPGDRFPYMTTRMLAPYLKDLRAAGLR